MEERKMSKNVDWNEGYGTGGKVIVECDQCHKTITKSFKDSHPYKAGQKAMSEKGWIARKIDEVWYDFCCDECFNKFKNGDDDYE